MKIYLYFCCFMINYTLARGLTISVIYKLRKGQKMTDENDVKNEKELLKELSKCKGIIRGSLITSIRKCGNKNCKCNTRGELHTVYLLSRSVGKGKNKNKIIYLRSEWVQPVKDGIENYHRALELLEQLSLVNIETLKATKGTK